jgi:hypothetical protein
MKHSSLTLGAALSLVVLTCVTATDIKPKPNIVLVVADDLGFNDLGARNGNKTITPYMASHSTVQSALTQSLLSFAEWFDS